MIQSPKNEDVFFENNGFIKKLKNSASAAL